MGDHFPVGTLHGRQDVKIQSLTNSDDQVCIFAQPCNSLCACFWGVQCGSCCLFWYKCYTHSQVESVRIHHQIYNLRKIIKLATSDNDMLNLCVWFCFCFLHSSVDIHNKIWHGFYMHNTPEVNNKLKLNQWIIRQYFSCSFLRECFQTRAPTPAYADFFQLDSPNCINI